MSDGTFNIIVSVYPHDVRDPAQKEAVERIAQEIVTEIEQAVTVATGRMSARVAAVDTVIEEVEQTIDPRTVRMVYVELSANDNGGHLVHKRNFVPKER